MSCNKHSKKYLHGEENQFVESLKSKEEHVNFAGYQKKKDIQAPHIHILIIHIDSYCQKCWPQPQSSSENYLAKDLVLQYIILLALGEILYNENISRLHMYIHAYI